MFQFLFKRAEVAIERTIGQILMRALIAVPFVIAIAFVIVAAWVRFSREYGSEATAIGFAAAFAVIGAIAAIAGAMTQKIVSTETAGVADAAGRGDEPSPQPEHAPMSDADRQLLQAAFGTVAPLALPHVLRLLLNNLPLVAAIGAAAFVMTRPAPSVDDTAMAEPAE